MPLVFNRVWFWLTLIDSSLAIMLTARAAWTGFVNQNWIMAGVFALCATFAGYAAVFFFQELQRPKQKKAPP